MRSKFASFNNDEIVLFQCKMSLAQFSSPKRHMTKGGSAITCGMSRISQNYFFLTFYSDTGFISGQEN